MAENEFRLTINIDHPGIRYLSDLSAILRDAAEQLEQTKETTGTIKNCRGSIVAEYKVV